jgi:MFS family permease
MRHPVFRALWFAQLTSNIGTLMQTVAAQWLMLSIDGRPQMVALVQAATSLPALLVGLLAGALGDVLDRRRLLICSQTFMLAAAATLGVVTLTGSVTPWTLLGLTFAIGLGSGLTGPTWQAIQPELVELNEIPQAAALGSMSMNIGRAAGPAVGGLLVATAGPGWAFMANAASFLGVLGVLAAWRREAPARTLGAEPVFSAVRSGLRYARSARRLRAILMRTALFIGFASAFWALLPVRAQALGFGATGYGLMLTAVGAGAVCGALISGRARRLGGVDALLTVATLSFGACCALLAFVDSKPIAFVAVFVLGGSWILAMATLNASTQVVLPDWVRARGMAVYLVVFQAGQAVGAILWGQLASHIGTADTLAVASVALVVGVVAVRWFPLVHAQPLDVSLAPATPEPETAVELRPTHGPVLVTLEYRVPPEHVDEFRRDMQAVGRVRRRGGAYRWNLFYDVTAPETFLEVFVVGSWEEHLRQHLERTSVSDQALLDRSRSHLVNGDAPSVTHYIGAYPG